MQNWLSEEEQYQEHLNAEQISRIRDPKLREIRMRHWKYRLDIFLDEQHISDQNLSRLAEADWKKEKEEIEDYKKELFEKNRQSD